MKLNFKQDGAMITTELMRLLGVAPMFTLAAAVLMLIITTFSIRDFIVRQQAERKSLELPQFSISAKPMAAARWLLPPPGGPNISTLAPLASQLSPAAMAVTCALDIIGTASKAKLSRVFPGGRWASAR